MTVSLGMHTKFLKIGFQQHVFFTKLSIGIDFIYLLLFTFLVYSNINGISKQYIFNTHYFINFNKIIFLTIIYLNFYQTRILPGTMSIRLPVKYTVVARWLASKSIAVPGLTKWVTSAIWTPT